MQTIPTTEYNSYDIDYQAFVDSLVYVSSGETVLVVTFDNIKKLVTKK